MVKAIVAVAAFAVALSTSGASAQPIMCNPSECTSTSQECTPCNPRLDGDCGPPFSRSGPTGQCSEKVPWDYQGVTYGVELYKRCRQIVDPGWTEVKPEPMNFGSYNKACREGFFTCNDGSCEYMGDHNSTEGVPHVIPEECLDEGIVDVDLDVAPDAKCNAANDDIFQAMNTIQGTLDYSKYCSSAQAGGIRYGPFRCSRSWADNISDCEENAREIQHQCEVNNKNILTELGFSDGCHADCNADEEKADLPGCCLDPEGTSICSNIQILDPTDSIPRCSDAKLVDDGCSECETGDSSTNTHPYCCIKNGETYCVNEFAVIAGTENDKVCAKDGKVNPAANVCYVDSDGSDANPPGISDTGVPAVGVDVSFKFDGRTPTNIESPCCCDVVCSCFGDPHCSSFSGRYEISQQSTGQFTMVDDPTPKFKIEAFLGRPLGVNKRVAITIDEDEYLFNAFDCVYDRNFTMNGESVPLSELPEMFEYLRDESRPTDAERAHPKIGRLSSLNAFMVNNPPFINFAYGPYKVQMKCVRFRMTQGYFSGSWWSRLDVRVTRETTAPNSGCCPPYSDILKQLAADDATGYCYASPFDAENHLPGSMDVTEGRRLTKKSSTDSMSRVRRALTEGKRDALEDKQAEGLVNKYARVQRISLVEAEVALHEQGERALMDAVQIAMDSCYTFASDPIFDYENKGECSQGLVLQAAKVGTNNWKNLKFFPRDVQYCDDSIKVIYEHTEVSPGVKLDNTYKLRLRHCTPDVSKCPQFDVCEPEPGVSDIGVVSYLYGSRITEYFESLVEFATANCPCAPGDAALCMSNCIGFGVCPEECV